MTRWGSWTSILLAISLGLTIVSGIEMLSRFSGSWAIVQAFDNDSALAVRKFSEGSWSDPDVGNSYGPLYYRVAHTLKLFDSATQEPLPEKERSGHFLMLLTSYLALLVFSGMIGFLIGTDGATRLSSTLVMLVAFLSDPTWSKFVFMAKPDMLLSCLIGAAYAATFRVVVFRTAREQRGFIIVSGLLWGSAVATKLNAVLFLASLGPILCWLFERRSWKRAAAILALSVVSYVIVGFPQTMDFKRVFDFYLPGGPYSTLMKPATLEGATYYLGIFWSELYRPLIAVVALTILWGPPKMAVPRRAWLLNLSPLAALVYLLKSSWTTDMSHFYMPVVAAIVVLIALMLPRLFSLTQFPNVRSIAALLVGVWVVGSGRIPQSMHAAFSAKNENRDAAELALQEATKLLEKGAVAAADPYSPFHRTHASQVKERWAHKFSAIGPEIDLFLTSRTFYERYLFEGEPGDYILADHAHEWKEVREFYRALHRSDEFKDPSGRKWQATFRSKAGWEVWTISK